MLILIGLIDRPNQLMDNAADRFDVAPVGAAADAAGTDPAGGDGGVDVLASTDIEADVFDRAVAVPVETDEVADLHGAQALADAGAAPGLETGFVRQGDTIYFIIYIQGKTGAVDATS